MFDTSLVVPDGVDVKKSTHKEKRYLYNFCFCRESWLTVSALLFGRRLPELVNITRNDVALAKPSPLNSVFFLV